MLTVDNLSKDFNEEEISVALDGILAGFRVLNRVCAQRNPTVHGKDIRVVDFEELRTLHLARAARN